jgi:hypothetical protein
MAARGISSAKLLFMPLQLELAPLLVWQHRAIMSASQRQFFLARAAPLKRQRVERQILITQMP